MSDYRINQTSGTASIVIVAGLLASQLIASQAIPSAGEKHHLALFAAPYQTESELPSFEQHQGIFGSTRGLEVDPFVENVSNFYATLVARQEPLGEEFSRVLHENLWDLYER